MVMVRIDDAQVRDAVTGELIQALVGQPVKIVERDTTTAFPIFDSIGDPIPGSVVNVTPVFTVPRIWIDVTSPADVYLDWVDEASGARGPVDFDRALRDASAAAATSAAASRVAAEAAQAAAEAVQVQAATDHGALSGLADDDHPQYLNTTRGDGRYYTKAQVDSIAAASASQQSNSDRNRANHYGEQPISSVTGLQAALDAAGSGGGGGGAVSSVNGRTGAVVVNKVDVGLGLVANTAPLDLPISTATQNALNTKAATTHTHSTAESWLSSALLGKASVVIVTTGNEARPSATVVLWIAAPGYAGGTPVNMTTGDLFFEGA